MCVDAAQSVQRSGEYVWRRCRRTLGGRAAGSDPQCETMVHFAQRFAHITGRSPRRAEESHRRCRGTRANRWPSGAAVSRNMEAAGRDADGSEASQVDHDHVRSGCAPPFPAGAFVCVVSLPDHSDEIATVDLGRPGGAPLGSRCPVTGAVMAAPSSSRRWWRSDRPRPPWIRNAPSA